MVRGIKVTAVEDIGNGQLRCTVTVAKSFKGPPSVPAGVYDNFIVDASDNEGLGPVVREILQAALSALTPNPD